MIANFEYVYEIGDQVHHATPDGDKGIVVNISYDLRNMHVRYDVAFGRRSEDNVLCEEEELSRDKVFKLFMLGIFSKLKTASLYRRTSYVYRLLESDYLRLVTQ